MATSEVARRTGSESASPQVTVIGLDGRTLPEPAAEALAAAALVVGGRRHLDAVPLPERAEVVVLGDVPAGVQAVARHPGPVVVLASGDPGFFGILRALRAAGVVPTVVPAVSSVAAAFAQVGLAWDDAVVVSTHGRELRRAVNVCRALPKVAVLTGPGGGPAELGAALVGQDRQLVVAEDLGGDEAVTWCRPEEAGARSWREPNVVLVIDPARAVGPRGWLAGYPAGPAGWALPEATYSHRDSMVTKAEVRALVLARLGPRPGDLVWDVGAGSGSVAVECARLGAAVIAVERDGDAVDRVRRNAAALHASVQVVTGNAPDALVRLPDPDAVFVGGGGLAVVAAAARRTLRTVVVTLAAVDRVASTRAALLDAGLTVDGVLLSAARLAPLPDGAVRLAAANPAFVLWGERAGAEV